MEEYHLVRVLLVFKVPLHQCEAGSWFCLCLPGYILFKGSL